ncbi:LLM class flavin-dependent oxidoreductase [Nocardioides abyssi]|uniref:LLM class flavin-dependent oxidoreductase n=1 Tax=Nocardioides abyssi TaxID=3058370 RepID=A0ABT8ENU9_9ACTN|nr:LLM class flavin-dependent oxidoreductase [Nocardioides abyssi]MDN4159819.1 LLM class flavin-dependent oxidoreductase [Nocardioides abyssi]
MKFGYMPDTHGGPYDQPMPDRERAAAFAEHLIAEAVATEEAGFDGAFVPERHARTETMWPDPLMALMAMAMRTSRIQLGTCVLQPAYYNPTHLAEQAALVDVASRGRLVLGVGSGYHEGYFRHFGEPYERRLGRFRESVRFLRRAWEGERFDWDGEHWQMQDVLVNPAPYRPGGPPMWFAGTTETAVRRAAREGDGLVLLGFYDPLPERRRIVDLYRSEARKAGRKPVVAQLLDGFVADTFEAARDTFGHLWVDEIAYYLKWGMIGWSEEIRSMADVTFENLQQYMVVGAPQDAAATIARFRDEMDLGDDDWVILRSRLPQGPSYEETLGSIHRLGTEVRPLLA